jgi:DNA-binding CsgD family transcriptional regulator
VQGHRLGAVPIRPVLTHRELQVLEQVAHGLRNREIGQRLAITEQTVKNHMSNLLRKLSLPGRTRAVVVAIERGWIPRGGGSRLTGASRHGNGLIPTPRTSPVGPLRAP